MHQRERMYQPFPAYFNTQSQLQPRMRGILFDWMTEVCQEFSLGRESHYLAMNLVDRYLSANPDVSRGRLQLIGVTALWMASKVI
jgi:cyclin E